MLAKIIDWKQIAAELRASTKEEVEKFVDQYGKKPTLAVVLVGEDPASQVYVNTKTKMAKEIGMNVEDHFLEKIQEWVWWYHCMIKNLLQKQDYEKIINDYIEY